jgi:Holliday junction resolvase RusA-like endonuclease
MTLTADELFGGQLSEVGQHPTPAAPAVKVPKARKSAPVIQPPDAYTGPISFVILGQPASKANSRELVTIAGRPQLIKSKAALAYERSALMQIPPKVRLQLTCKLAMELRVYYETERSDLDESLVLDVLQNRTKLVPVPGTDKKERVLVQAGVYVNDRQVRERHVYHGIDAKNPRTELRIWSIASQEVLL